MMPIEDGTPSICVVLGTRPGIIKFAPVLWRLREMDIPHFVIHSGQHYSSAMDAVFFADLDLAEPEYRAGTMRPGIPQGEQTAEMLTGIERTLLDRRPGMVLVGGDANTNLAGALAARKLDLPLGHVEAGLRSDDWRMPEEHNRIIIDHISDVLFVPSERAAKVAESEGVHGVIEVTGSTIGETLQWTLERSRREASSLHQALDGVDYILVTLHRKENVDDAAILAGIVSALTAVPGVTGMRLVWPIHPRTEQRLCDLGLRDDLESTPDISLLPPVGHREFVPLLNGAALVITDSGGVQQEACILGVPCVTTRPSTEWVETLEVGANRAVGTRPEDILAGVVSMLAEATPWPDPFIMGDLPASTRTVDLTLESMRALP